MSSQYWLEISFYINEIDKEAANFSNTTINPESMDSVRKKFTNYLELLKGGLEQTLEKQWTSLVLFAIIASIDEDMQRLVMRAGKESWAPLQKDFYGAYNAGEMFFKSIDDILDDSNVPSIVFEIFYFILKREFQGKYRDSKTQLAKYLEMLCNRIAITKATKKEDNPLDILPEKRGKFKKWHYYLLSALGIIVLYIGLFLYSKT